MGSYHNLKCYLAKGYITWANYLSITHRTTMHSVKQPKFKWWFSRSIQKQPYKNSGMSWFSEFRDEIDEGTAESISIHLPYPLTWSFPPISMLGSASWFAVCCRPRSVNLLPSKRQMNAIATGYKGWTSLSCSFTTSFLSLVLFLHWFSTVLHLPFANRNLVLSVANAFTEDKREGDCCYATMAIRCPTSSSSRESWSLSPPLLD